MQIDIVQNEINNKKFKKISNFQRDLIVMKQVKKENSDLSLS